MSRNAVYAGSFDPLTNGHLNIIERAARMYDSLTVAVIVNQNKDSMFTVEKRMEIIRKVTGAISGVRVDCFDGLLADYVNNNGYDVVVRGLRSSIDFEYELLMAHMNARLFTGNTETVFLMTDPAYSYVSSSLIKEVASLGGSIDGLVPQEVKEELAVINKSK